MVLQMRLFKALCAKIDRQECFPVRIGRTEISFFLLFLWIELLVEDVVVIDRIADVFYFIVFHVLDCLMQRGVGFAGDD